MVSYNAAPVIWCSLPPDYSLIIVTQRYCRVHKAVNLRLRLLRLREEELLVAAGGKEMVFAAERGTESWWLQRRKEESGAVYGSPPPSMTSHYHHIRVKSSRVIRLVLVGIGNGRVDVTPPTHQKWISSISDETIPVTLWRHSNVIDSDGPVGDGLVITARPCQCWHAMVGGWVSVGGMDRKIQCR